MPNVAQWVQPHDDEIYMEGGLLHRVFLKDRFTTHARTSCGIYFSGCLLRQQGTPTCLVCLAAYVADAEYIQTSEKELILELRGMGTAGQITMNIQIEEK